MSFGNFLRRLSFDTEKMQTEVNETTEGTSSINSLFAAPGKLIESVNVKTGNLVSDLNQKLDLGAKLDSLKQASVNKFEHVVRGASGTKEESGVSTGSVEDGTGSLTQPVSVPPGTHANPFNSPQPASVSTEQTITVVPERRESQEKAPLRRQSTNAGPRPPRPPPPTAAALSRAMSVDQANISMAYGKDSKVSKSHRMPEMLEEEDDRPADKPYSTHGVDEDADDGSSASEYGACGDTPVYKQDDEPDLRAASSQPGEKIFGHSVERSSKTGVNVEHVESVINICVPALINGAWHQVQERDAELLNILETSFGRMSFVNKIEQESVRTEGLLQSSALPALLDKISLLLNECEDAEDFSPAKKILTVSLLFYVTDPASPNDRTFLFNYIKSQPIWQSLRFWNACFFQSVQEARAKFAERSDIQKKPEEIVFEQLKSYLNTMNVFDLHETIKYEFLRKHSNLFNLTDDETQVLRGVIEGAAT